MDKDIINLNPDPLAEIEASLRGDGLWCDVYGITDVQHYYMAKNPKLNTAVSLCGQSIKGFSALVVTAPRKKCLVCDLFYASREEAKNHRDTMQDVKKEARSKKSKYRQATLF